ncbi:hypothetical protein G5V59_25035 [Nocardioides sp. W3-2-3]|uniref:hypothetical protein n=1 Tax=Nocardioides convexus TaxID=2712224 RepID=UPI00241889A4|nr:hypothetical protein [Nocardioides convexus]NHA01826.1 hypothetical protein [Nocardioides convexus]
MPPFLSTSLAAPYALGGGLLQLAVALHGKGAVDDLFASPPPTEEALVDPWTHLVDKQGRKPVDAPKAGGRREGVRLRILRRPVAALRAGRADRPAARPDRDRRLGRRPVRRLRARRSLLRPSRLRRRQPRAHHRVCARR